MQDYTLVVSALSTRIIIDWLNQK